MSFTDEMITGVVGGVVLAIYLLALVVAVVDYVLVSLSLYTLAKRRGIRAPGLAWVPIANYWLLGSLTNEIDAKNGFSRKWNVTLLTLSLTAVIGVVISYASLIIAGAAYALSYAGAYIEPELGTVLGMILPFYILLILAMVIAVALSICAAVCMFKVFESTVPQKAVKYLLLYLMVPLAGGICLFKARNQGYPFPETSEPIAEE